MFIIMCEIRKYTGNKSELQSVHPVHAVETLREAHEWMDREPEIIVEHLNDMKEDKWHVEHKNKQHARIWNKNMSLERTYLYKQLD